MGMIVYKAAEFIKWLDNNCRRCSRYEDESAERGKARCKVAFALDIGMVTGFVSGKAHRIYNLFTEKDIKCPYMQAGA